MAWWIGLTTRASGGAGGRRRRARRAPRHAARVSASRALWQAVARVAPARGVRGAGPALRRRRASVFGTDPASRIVVHAYFVFPPLLWAALRFGQPGAAAATFALAGFAVLGTAAGLRALRGVDARGEPPRAPDVHGQRGAHRSCCSESGARNAPEKPPSARSSRRSSSSADRLAAVGTLPAGIGHEINNPLASLILNLDAAREIAARRARRAGRQRAPSSAELLGTAQEGANRIRRIVGDLKSLARDEGSARGPTDVHKVLELLPSRSRGRCQIRHRAAAGEVLRSPAGGRRERGPTIAGVPAPLDQRGAGLRGPQGHAPRHPHHDAALDPMAARSSSR